MKKLLVRGNVKLDSSVLCWSITPITSCLNSSQCAKHCYARFPYVFYPPVKNAWDSNFEIAKAGIFIEPMIDQIKRSRTCKTVRIHVAGDFFNQEYINNWAIVAKALPNIKFYSYTKVFDLLDFSDILSLSNVNIINSITADGGINFGDKQRVSYLKEQGYIECPAIADDTVSCGKSCTICHTENKVCFLKHK